MIPDAWLLGDSTFGSGEQFRSAYIEYFLHRLDSSAVFVEEAVRARSLLV
jgi:hypothetical protein